MRSAPCAIQVDFPVQGSTSVLSMALIQRKLGHFDRLDVQRHPPLLQEHRQG